MLNYTGAALAPRKPGLRVTGGLVLAALLFACLALAQANSVEDFDLTGLPPKATNFAEQHLMDKIDRHKAGDIQDAIVIQQKLAAYYRHKGDDNRARIAEERAQSAERTAPAPASVQTLAGPADTGSSLLGRYACRSAGSQACDTKTTLSLGGEGVWTWALYEGHYEIQGTTITFTGVLSNWGPAEIGPDTLTFMSGQQKVIWQKPSLRPPALAGRYQCLKLTRIPLDLQPDGTYIWGRRGGSFTVIGDVVKFGGTTTSPAAWGLCNVVNGALVFHSGNNISEWRKQP